MTQTELHNFLSQLWQQGLELWLDGEQLRFKGNQALLTGDILNLLRQHKEEIVTSLQQHSDLYSGFIANQGQRGIYFMQQLAPKSSIYHQACLLRLSHSIDTQQLQRSLNALIQRHEALRSRFLIQQGLLKQVVMDSIQLELDIKHLTDKESLGQWYQVQADTAFDLHNGPLFRASLAKQNEQVFLVFCAHHLIADFWAIQKLIHDWQALYLQEELPDVAKNLKDFHLQEQEWLQSEQGLAAKAFWHQQLQPLAEPLNLHFDHTPPAISSYQGQELSFNLSPELSQKLKLQAKQHSTTAYAWTLSCLQLLLHRYSGMDDICIGSPVANRLQRDSQQLAGHFANPLVLRHQFQQGARFNEILASNKELLTQAFRHQQYPIQNLIDELRPQQHLPFFQVAMAWSQFDALQLNQHFALAIEKMEQRGAIYPLVLSCYDAGDFIKINWRFDSELYQESSVHRFQQHLQLCLESSLNKPEQAIAEIIFLSAEEQALYQQINQTKSDIPRNISIAKLFENTVERFPHHIAFRDVQSNKNTSYQSLNTQANQIAQYLKEQNFIAGDVVGLALGRCLENTAWLLACVKSGIIYIPIDPDNPDERIATIEQSAKAKAIVCHQQRQLSNVIALDSCQTDIDAQSGLWEIAHHGFVEEDTTACIFYTSGSTGVPKGVEIPHRAIVRLTHNTNFADYQADERFCHICNTAFDASNVEIWSALLHGGCLLYLDNNSVLSPSRFADFILQEKPTATVMTTALFNLYVQYQADIFKNFRYVMFGGEAADKHICNLCIRTAKPQNLLNVYGPTENGTYSTVYLFEEEVHDQVPIGFVVNNSQAYIYDQYDQLAPIGVIGELIVGGDGVATGYRNQPELSQQTFLPDHYRGKGLLYRTGDLAWLREDGMIMYAGRADAQVKLRGFRIETGEVEQRLLAISGISQAFVDVDASHNYLIVWFVADKTIDTQMIKQQLSQQLPDFMVPAAYLVLDALPLTANGKIDRRALPEPAIERQNAYVAPQSELEQQLCVLWQEHFALDKIGINDNFFDLGGHSLLAAKLVSAIEEHLNVSVDMRMIFAHSDIQSLARAIENNNADALPAIIASNEQQAISASLSQQRLWFLQQLNSSSSAYNMPLALRLLKPITAERIENAINTLIQRHDALHTAFIDQQGEARLVLRTQTKVNLDIYQLASQSEFEQHLQQFSQSTFDLSHAPLLRAQLVHQGQQTFLLLCLHHIAIDGISANILLSEMAQLLQGEVLSTEPLLRYYDFSLWQQAQQSHPAWQQQIEYWQTHLADTPSVLSLPTDKPRPAIFAGQAEKVDCLLSLADTEQLEQIAKQQHISSFMLFMAGFAVLLQRYCQQDQFGIGFPIAGRQQAALQQCVGLFVNNLVIRHDFTQLESISDLFQQIKSHALAAFAHQDVPFDQIIDALNIERSLSYTPYLQASFAYEELNIEERVHSALDGLFSLIEPQFQAAKYDINLSCFKQKNGQLLLEFEYNNSLFTAESIKQWAEHYQRILKAFLTPEALLADIRLLTAEEEQRLVSKPFQAATNQHVINTFSTICQKHAQRTALSFEGQSVSYDELNQITNRLAHSLHSRGIRQGDFVGLYFDRSLEMVYSILAVFKLGAAYIPLDPHSPAERVHYIIDDAKPACLIGEKQHLQQLSLPSLAIEDLLAQSHTQSSQSLACDYQLSDAAYVIYTSGTTGKPKGCVVNHLNLSRLFTSTEHEFSFNENDVWTLFHSYAFDFSVWEMWGALLYGGELIIIPYWLSRSSDNFYQLLADKKVTVLNQTPSAFSQIIQADQQQTLDLQLRYIVFGGEALDFHALKQWLQRHPLNKTQLINMYGITETTVHASYYAIGESDFTHPLSIIGKPLSDLQIYLLDPQQNLVADGMIGEIYVSGPGVTPGYLYKPELTAERFIANPFASYLNKEQASQHQVLYRSGDLAKRSKNGNLEYLGRCDHQVKIRGHRIELGEIEAALNHIPYIRESLVRTYEGTYGLQLIAWFISSHKNVALSELRRELQKQLPDYMLPNAFIALDAWPLTANGKVDIKALPKADFHAQQNEYTPPSNDTEQQLCTIWQDVLGLEQVGVHDNFFELGGHSLLATKLAARIRSELNSELALQHIFEYPTIAELTAVLPDKNSAIEIMEIPQLERHQQGYDLSFAQQRLWFLEQLYPDSATYHIAVAIELTGDLDIAVLEQSFLQLIQRHESLRTSFIEADNCVQQQIIAINNWQLEQSAFSGDLQQQLERDACQAFDLSQAPLIRCKLYRTNEQQQVLSVVMHHIISDAWSSQILLHELSSIYNALKRGEQAQLAPLSTQYIDYSVWQKQQLASDAYQQQKSYWLEQLQALDNLQLGSDKQRPAILSQQGASELLQLNHSEVTALSQLCQQHKTSLYVGLLAAFQFLLYRYSQQTNFAIGTPVAGRNHPDTQQQIGFFVNTQALPCQILEGESFVQLLERVRQQNFTAQSQQDIPFEQIIDQLQLARDGSYSPVFQAFFSFQPDSLEQAIALDGIATRFIDITTPTAKFELSLIIREQDKGLHCLFEYNSDIYTTTAIKQLAQHFSLAVQALSQKPEQALNRINFLSDDEQTQLLASTHPRQYPVRHLADCFEEQVAKTPDKIAVVQGNTQLSYAELNQKANQLAAYLLEQGIGANDFIGLCFAPCWELPVAILASLKIGACYVPIDPSYPAQRIAYMLDFLQVKTLISSQRFSQNLASDCLDIHTILELQADSDVALALPKRDSEQLLYVIFTSGSTGTPKAAAVYHRNASNLLHWYSEHYQLSPHDKLLVFSAIGFDLTQKNLLAPLCFGAELHFSSSEFYDPDALLETIAKQQITWTNCAPSAFYPLASHERFSELNSLKKLFFGGEPIRLDNLQPWLAQSDCTLSNMYGPTECTDIATSFTFDKHFTQAPIPIGTAAANVDCYVLDAQQNLLPKGAVGELYIGGLGVGAGYLHNPQLNQDSFIEHPFKAKQRLYKTGDLVRFNEQDQLIFIGRADQQLKIRGFRIELGEIEAQLRLLDGVKQAVVAVQDIQQQAQLCAFIVSDSPLQSRDFYRKALQQIMPDYMVPIAYQSIDSIPLSPNGKVDRKQLPQLSSDDIAAQQDYIAPRNAIEESLADILQSVLQLPKVGIHDNFFDLGGNSLSATQVISRIKQAFALDLPLRTLFETPTIEALAAVITALSQTQLDQYDDDDFEEGIL